MPHRWKVVHQANLSPMENSNDNKVYIGISEGNCKQRLYNRSHYFPSSIEVVLEFKKCLKNLRRRISSIVDVTYAWWEK